MADDDVVTVQLVGPVAVVELHRPPHNFFDVASVSALADAVLEVGSDPRCRATVLATEGKNFCAGAALGGAEAMDVATLYEQAARLASSPVPVVAAVQGAAVGGGLGLAMVADFRVATPETRFTCNFAKLGFHHGFGLSATLPDAVGQQRALELLYTGGTVMGTDAAAWGLAERVVPLEDLRSAAMAFAEEIAASAPLSIRSIRATMRGDVPDRIRRATAREQEQQALLLPTADFVEGVAATAERRPPSFVGR
ncbi:MAG: short chain 3-hydroxyacyl-CoA dehydrogenase / enoyl-CoA hydratase [Actinomycetia bacterium]|nr:short chain 3-hydroxyacyl-CoA dehydrogenase / enoyl-CoA hydratase [Actinomycetes bacterium]